MHRVGHAVILSERHRQPIDHDWKTERRVKKEEEEEADYGVEEFL